MRHRSGEFQRRQGRRSDRMLHDRKGRRDGTIGCRKQAQTAGFRVPAYCLLPTGFAMHRPERIADTLREEIAQIVGYELEDPRLAIVTVTDVRVADDLRDASVFVTVAGDEHEHELAFIALRRAAPYVRKQLGF